MRTLPRASEPCHLDHGLLDVLKRNRVWAAQVRKENPSFFLEMAKGQNPPILWIGCSDSRVPPNQVLQLKPGEIFVHRNIGNGYYANDRNCNAVIDYAVRALGVKHIILCGHYCCGAVGVGIDKDCGLHVVEEWISQIRRTYQKYSQYMTNWPKEAKQEVVCELNAIYNARKLVESPSVKWAWSQGKSLTIHAWCFRLCTGHVEDMGFTIQNDTYIDEVCEQVMFSRVESCIYYRK
jgi:carbonic anhydrase